MSVADEPQYERIWRNAGARHDYDLGRETIELLRHVLGTGLVYNPPAYIARFGFYATGARTAAEAGRWLASMSALAAQRRARRAARGLRNTA